LLLYSQCYLTSFGLKAMTTARREAYYSRKISCQRYLVQAIHSSTRQKNNKL